MRVLVRLRHLLEMIRFSHTLFALPFALLSAAMAWSANLGENPPVRFRVQELLGILVCMVCARSAAMAFNRLADMRFDAMNPRTAGRHLVTGVLRRRVVVWFVVVSSLGFVAGTLLFLPRNPIPLAMSLPVLLFLFGYSFTKRFTALSHFWLGTALMLAPLGAWVALRPVFHPAPLLLGVAVMLWVAGFDMIYACQDAAFDRRAGLQSIPARLGVATSLRIAAACHAAMVLVLLLLPSLFDRFGRVFYIGTGGIAALLIVEHFLVRPDDLRRVNVAFFYVNAVVSIGLLIVGLVDLAV